MVKGKAMKLWFEFSSVHNDFKKAIKIFFNTNMKKRFSSYFIKPTNSYFM
jgi:hypothetical protein